MKKIVIVLVVLVLILYNSQISSGIKIVKEEIIDNQIAEETIVINEDIESKIENFENIKIGDSLDSVKASIGNPARIDESEYDFKWHVYNQQINKFVMVGIKDNTVVALFSNSINSCESENIKLNDYRTKVRESYSPIEYKQKGNTKYIINSENQYDIIKENKKYITAFYDIYEDSKVCSYQIIDSKCEKSLDGIYAKGSEELRKSFELQVIDLTNSVRIKKGLRTLNYSEKATTSSRLHSEDMLEKNFFDHINKNKQTPFDRMKKEGIVYRGAGENIAAGQTSAIYAHEAWMNSEGHRKNILGDYSYIGVGVSFGGYYSIYYTQNFYI